VTTQTPLEITPHRFSRWLLVSLVIGGIVMALAGEWTSVYLWGFTLGISGVFLYATVFVLDDDLARERFRPPSHGADAVALRRIRLSALATLVFAPLDAGRLHWSAEIPDLLRLIAIALSTGSFFLVVRAMMANRFFSPVIRVQGERGHGVIDHGPYAVVRHPGYFGMVLFAPAAALALGSWWALIPAGIYSSLILRRVFVEDRFLHANLVGYAEYAGRVPHRVIPGIW
jgi:protein-S-isoprenylcysteine O-methyltransferase Ste14